MVFPFTAYIVCGYEHICPINNGADSGLQQFTDQVITKVYNSNLIICNNINFMPKKKLI